MNLLDPNLLFASLFWGSVGVGYFIYGKRRQSWVPFAGGVAMIAASYVAESAWVMTAVCVGLMGAVHLLIRQGY